MNHINQRVALTALMLGNFLIGVTVLAPAGMLTELAEAFAVSIPRAGLLVTYGAIMLCIGSPVVAWLTGGRDRRGLLVLTVLALAVGHGLSALAPNYKTLLVIRLAMLPIAAAFTPQAAGAAAAMTSEADRPGAIAYVFLGWSLAVAAGLPLVTFGATHIGWRLTMLAIAGLSLATLGMLIAALPRGVRSDPVRLATWAHLFSRGAIVLMWAVTALQLAAQFVVFPFIGPMLTRLTASGAGIVGVFFGLFGVMGFAGNVLATRIVSRWGAFHTGLVFLAAMALGALIWSVGAGTTGTMAFGFALWGLGFAAVNSMQQARLALSAPTMAAAAIAINTSCIYIGQGIGSAIGGAMFAQGWLIAMGAVATALLGLSLAAYVASRRA